MNPLTVTLERGGGLDEYGDPVDYPILNIEVPGCKIAPTDSADTTGRGRSGAVDRLTLYLPFGTDVHPDDRVVIADGPHAGTWAVDGDPGHWQSPFTGRTPGATVTLQRAHG